MSEQHKEYTHCASCHCGNVVYQTNLPSLYEVGSCDCSICYKKGYLTAEVANLDQISFIKGDASQLTKYSFGTKTYSHEFCGYCGTALFITNSDSLKVLLNVRAFQDVDISKLKTYTRQSKVNAGPYDPPGPRGYPVSAKRVDGDREYTGSCHCGDVTLHLFSEPLDEDYKGLVTVCDCSICERNANIWLYIPKMQCQIAALSSSIGHYLFGTNLTVRLFCKVCGVSVSSTQNPDIPSEEIAEWPTGRQELYKNRQGWDKINLRAFGERIDLSRLTVTEVSRRSDEPLFVNPCM